MRVRLECALPAERVLLALRDEPWPFALTGRWAGGGAIVGASPRALLGADEDPFTRLEDLPEPSGDAEVGGGWFGWLGYGLVRLPPSPPRPVPLPHAHLAYYDHVLRQDAAGTWWFESLGDDAPLERLCALLAAAPSPSPPEVGEFALRAPGAAGHVAAVRECVERIAAGDILQAHLSLRLETAWEGSVAELFAAASSLRPDYGACFVTPWGGIVSVSPEPFRGRGHIAALFPPGSVTGAPKVQALHVISELEATGREVYTGAIGYASPHAGLELSVAIRTFEARDGRLWLGAGGGIVASSDPEAELEECLVEARPLISAINGRLGPRTENLKGPGPFRFALAPDRRRPDPALGVFTTMRVRDGVPVRLEAHLARLSRSVFELYGERLPEVEIPDVDGAVRIVFVPGNGVRVEPRPLTRRELPIVLTPYVLPGGLGAHKWVDRRLVDALGGTPLLLDADGTVLEAGWASVLVRRDGRLLTPRTDGRILPSTSRPDAEETDIRLQDGDELFLSSATSEVVPAVLAATSPEPPADTRRTRLRTGA